MFDALTTSSFSSSSVLIRLLAATGVRMSGQAKMSPSMRGQNGERGQKTKNRDRMDLEKEEQK